MRYILILVIISWSFNLNAQHEQKYYPVQDSIVQKKIETWQGLKFGLLMHWGAYSQWGIVESWSICPEEYGWCERKMGSNPRNYFDYKKEYENLKNTFNPVDFDPALWAKAAKDAGMRYIVFTTKHHDGFCMFDSKYTDYKVTNPLCPFSENPKANISKEIFNAFRNEGLWAGAYFSKPDWHHPDYWDPYYPPRDRHVNYSPAENPEKWQSFVDFTHNQVLELVKDYGPIDILWFDGGWVAKESKSNILDWYEKNLDDSEDGYLKNRAINQDIRMDELVKKLRDIKKDIIVVDRAVEGPNQNYLTPENQVPDSLLPFPWESCIISSGSWSWIKNPKYMTGAKAVHLLIDVVAKGGNLLLNIAPGPDGKWDQGAYELLKEIGSWMNINSEAIYDTHPFYPYKLGKMCFTEKKDNVYIHCLFEEKEIIPNELIIPIFDDKAISSIELLGIDYNIEWEIFDKGLKIELPEKLSEKIKYAFVLKIKR